MSWNPGLLSTTATIAEHEKEINDMAGKKQVWSLLGGDIDESNDYELTCPADTDYVIYTNSDQNEITDESVASLVWTLPETNVIGFSCYDSSDNLLATFSCTEGRGLTLTATNAETATLNNSGAWALVEIDQTWADKISLAKLLVKYAIENTLTDQGYSVNELQGLNLIDMVTNADTFRIACDYKALALIYEDLAYGGMSDLFTAKMNRYHGLYEAEFAKAIRRIALDPSLSGSATIGRANFTGYLSR